LRKKKDLRKEDVKGDYWDCKEGRKMMLGAGD